MATIHVDGNVLSDILKMASLDHELKEISLALHDHPETAYEEVFAHDTLTQFLEKQGFAVKRSTYGLRTSFEAEVGSGGRIVVFCAEYDALPQIGHACGHNLIAVASLGAFIKAAWKLKDSGKPGRLRLLGTPAEEGGGGKALLIEAGAFDDDIAAAIMAHPMCAQQILGPDSEYTGVAALKLIHKFKTEFRGKTAHAAGEPWNGVNALDAAVAAYSNVGLLRQQMAADGRVHAVIEAGGTVPNVIPDYTRMNWNVRSSTIARADELLARVKACIAAAATASGCAVEYIVAPTYLNLTANRALCEAYVAAMAEGEAGERVALRQQAPLHASTDMGNVAHKVPSFHGAFVIPAAADVAIHNPRFAAAARTDEALAAALRCAGGMAALALRVLEDDELARAVRDDFELRHDW